MIFHRKLNSKFSVSSYAVLVLLLTACNELPQGGDSTPGRIDSISKKYYVISSIVDEKNQDYMHIKLSIFDAKDRLEYEEITGASRHLRWELAWDQSDRIWLYSSDIGTDYWEKQDSGKWTKRDYKSQLADQFPTPPERILYHEQRTARR